jgi:hypothetical protein
MRRLRQAWRPAAGFGLYAGLLAAYVMVVLHLLAEPLRGLMANHLHWYAAVSLVLIVLQGVGLEWLASWILSRFLPGWAE